MMRILLAFLMLLPAGSFAAPTTLSTVVLSETATAFAENSADVANGNRVLNPNCDLFFLFRNSHESDEAAATVTAQGTSVTLPGYGVMTKANASVSLTAGQQKHIGPFRCAAWNDTSGFVQVTYSGAASSSVKVTPLRIPTTF